MTEIKNDQNSIYSACILPMDLKYIKFKGKSFNELITSV